MKSLALLGAMAGVAAIGVWGYWHLALIIQWVVGLAIGAVIVLVAIGVVGIASAILSSPLALLAFLLGGWFFGDDC